MLSSLKYLATSTSYWGVMLGLAVLLEAVALFYQHVLGFGPCPLCIHVRVGVLGFLLVSLLALLLPVVVWRRVCHLLNLGVFAWLSERAYWLLGTERGFAFTECGLDANLPAWLALDRWLPAMFEPWESCGYTPELLFGVTMAEASMLLFPLLLLLSLAMLILSFMRS